MQNLSFHSQLIRNFSFRNSLQRLILQYRLSRQNQIIKAYSDFLGDKRPGCFVSRVFTIFEGKSRRSGSEVGECYFCRVLSLPPEMLVHGRLAVPYQPFAKFPNTSQDTYCYSYAKRGSMRECLAQENHIICLDSKPSGRCFSHAIVIIR